MFLIRFFLTFMSMLLEQSIDLFFIKAVLACPILCFISIKLLAFSVIVLPRYLKCFTCLIGSLLTRIFTVSGSFEHTRTSVFFIFIFILYSFKTSFIQSKERFRFCSSGASTAMSSASLNI
uniref:Uncharacterized protein n=1 Tax=Cacopsylla melanoneura TaxID=428564 RepID=A0A8D9ESY9_9HEMI